jgi:ubiquinone/menaquinone biosynthesis C-methylase UbiE
VTVTDFSQHALEICRERDPRLETRLEDAEHHDLPDESFDIVLVQDGLHELRRPTIGLTEMLRLSRVITIVIEPYDGNRRTAVRDAVGSARRRHQLRVSVEPAART